jgi:hypothetical protein
MTEVKKGPENYNISKTFVTGQKPEDDMNPSEKMKAMKEAEDAAGGPGKKDVKGKKKKLAIIGCSDSRDQAPWGDDTWEMMGVNNLYHHVPLQSFTSWFEIHFFGHDGKGNISRRYNPVFRGQKVNEYLEQLGQLKFPVYVQSLDLPLIENGHIVKIWENGKKVTDMSKSIPIPMPNAAVFPFDDLLRRFHPYFTNTISWQIAWAIYNDFEEIGIWGVDMAVAEEYMAQRPSVEYYLGIAEGLGIKITLPDECDLLKTLFQYGLQEPEATAYEKKLSNVKKNLAMRRAKEAETARIASKKEDQYTGALEGIREMQKIQVLG